MNIEELKVKYLDYLTKNGKLDDEKLSKFMSLPASIFLSGTDFINFIKENISSLGIKNTSKIPNTVEELIEMVSEEKEEEYDTSELHQAASDDDEITK